MYGIPALLTGIINVLLSLVALLGNALILMAIWRNTVLRTPSYILLAVLVASDFATGLITQPLYAANMVAAFYEHRLNCFAIESFHTSARYLAIVTTGTIAIMAVERWLHMTRRSMITVHRAYVICGVLFCFPIPYIVARMWLISMKS